MENNYLISVFVGGKCVDLFFSENLCELHVCRLLHRGCEIEVHDMRSFAEIPKENVNACEKEMQVLVKKRFIPEQVVCMETKQIYQSLDVCAQRIGESVSDLMYSISQLTDLGGYHYLMSSDLFDGKDLGKNDRI